MSRRELIRLKKKKRVKGNHVIFSLVFLVLGYMIAFSYHLTQSEKSTVTGKQWERDLELRNQLVSLEEKNRLLQSELNAKRERVQEIEKELSQEAQIYFNLAEDAEKFRMYLGKIKVKGQGVEVTLTDGAYNPNEKNINNYIVHEHHVFKVINELYISGAQAVAINGQRLSHNSYILCNGPVIEVDGYQHPAPFVITAIGDADVLAAALNLTGGVKDSLVNENIQFALEKKTEISIDPLLGS
ncbi:DUF881 domain-containing protein [Bacillus sp. FJAT-29790]|uniref:DUF881 domain-containing protein n=1 Tax=Bacillus sp. FJAT-29790 TaxID=1895002 RepID=UPI001C230C0F|nr:DUF881 domain-containing protein [Bacillus sp. FJAT-29790]MBU8877728.1 DUF881 domain-containing protein [Bacillus sp. FJAT-29790]